MNMNKLEKLRLKLTNRYAVYFAKQGKHVYIGNHQNEGLRLQVFDTMQQAMDCWKADEQLPTHKYGSVASPNIT